MNFYQHFRKKFDTFVARMYASIHRSSIVADRSELFRLELTRLIVHFGAIHGIVPAYLLRMVEGSFF